MCNKYSKEAKWIIYQYVTPVNMRLSLLRIISLLLVVNASTLKQAARSKRYINPGVWVTQFRVNFTPLLI